MADLINRKKLLDDIDNLTFYATLSFPLKASKIYEIKSIIQKLLDSIIEIIKNSPSESGWIPCSERLPEDQTRVLIKTIYGGMCIAKRCGNGDWYTDGSGTYHAHEVIRWMPLPKEGADDA